MRGNKGSILTIHELKFLTTCGELELYAPQVRSSQFYPSYLDKGGKLEQAVKLPIIEP